MTQLSVEVNQPFKASRIAHLYADREDLNLANPFASHPFDPSEWDKIFPKGTQNSSLLFKVNDSVIGHCTLLVKEETLYLCFVILARAYRGTSLAQQMLKETEEFSRLNYTHQELFLHVDKRNLRARKLYENAGYQLVQEFPEKIRMKKNLW